MGLMVSGERKGGKLIDEIYQAPIELKYYKLVTTNLFTSQSLSPNSARPMKMCYSVET